MVPGKLKEVKKNTGNAGTYIKQMLRKHCLPTCHQECNGP